MSNADCSEKLRRIYIKPGKSYDFPENKDEELKSWRDSHSNFGIALSGGGMRAAINALGWLQGLNDAKLLEKAKYIAFNSGSSWVTTMIVYAAVVESGKTEADISKSYEKIMAEMSLSYLAKASPKFARKLLSYIFQLLRLDFSGVNVWREAVRIFMQFGSYNDPLYNDDLLEALQDENKNHQFPFLIVNGSIIDITSKQRPFKFYAYELTPYYCGIPVDTDSTTIFSGFSSPSLFNNDVKNENVIEGNDRLYVSAKECSLLNRSHLSDVAGISSNFLASKIEMSRFNFLVKWEWLTAIYLFFVPVKNDINNAYIVKGGKYGFVDGGLYDNSGINA